MRKRASCFSSSACRSGRTRKRAKGKGQRAKGKYGDNSQDGQGTESAEIQDSAAQPLPPVRPSARVHAQVRAVPLVLPQARAGWRHHGSHEEQLVIWSMGNWVMDWHIAITRLPN